MATCGTVTTNSLLRAPQEPALPRNDMSCSSTPGLPCMAPWRQATQQGPLNRQPTLARCSAQLSTFLSQPRDGGGLVAKSCPTLATPWTVTCQAPLSMGFPRQEYWCGLPFPSPGDLLNPGIEPRSPALLVDYLLICS